MTNKSHPQNKTYALSTLAAAGMVFTFAFYAAPAIASEPRVAPVPSYGGFVSTTDSTTANIPAELAGQWRGLFTIGTGSVIKRPELTPRDYILATLFGGATASSNKRTYKYNPSAIYAWTGQLAQSLGSKTSEPAIKIENGRVVEFTPPETGKALDRYNSTLRIIEELQKGKTSAELIVYKTEPSIDLGELNDLGIKELIGRGESKFGGSPRNRQHNIKVGIEKMKGIIIKPGEEFSFNKYLGPVEANTGFLPELVIKATGTVPEFGGGLCQVSSTTWRAAMNAGLPITQRRNHSYAVSYYGPQGTDATIYPGVIDLKFTNDTGNSILVWPYLKTSDYLVFDFYGTFDGRKVELGTPVQFDRKSDGSMKAYWTRKVTKNGETKEERFNSTYQPPALFHRQEQFVTAPSAGSPSPTPIVGTPSVTPSPTTTPTPKPTKSSN
jgi:vancomycin resistance protein YoaR